MGIEETNPKSESSSRRYQEPRVVRPEHTESSVTRLIEQQAAKIPSDAFLASALASMLASMVFEVAGSRRASRFMGMWVAPLLVMGVYNKLVKLFGAT